jgi:chromosome partitioning protein
MSETIVLCSSKGGTGKTTTALNLSVALAERGHATLLVDLDPQGAIGLALSKPDTEWAGLTEVMAAGAAPDQVVIETALPQLRILARGRLDPVDAATYEVQLYSGTFLDGVMKAVTGSFEYVLLDTPSGLGPVTRSALRLSRWALVPLQAEPIALRCLGQTLRVLDHVKAEENPDLELLGILPTMVELGHDPSLNVMSSLWGGFGAVMDTVVPRAEAFARASEAGVPVGFLGGGRPPEARRYALLADEVEDRIRARSGDGAENEQEHRRLV